MKQNYKIACIGAGNMGSALMAGAAKKVGGASVTFTDHSAAKAEGAAQKIGAKFSASNVEAVVNADIVFFAVKPYALSAVIKETAASFTKGKIAVSMAAGVSLADLKRHFKEAGGALPEIVRIMPNTPCLVGKGVIALSTEDGSGAVYASREAKDAVADLLSLAGLVDTMEEKYIDAETALAGCGPAFCYLFLEALADGGVLTGLSRAKALKYAALTMEGAAQMLLQEGAHPGKLKDDVASPGGATIRGLLALERGAFRGAVIEAVKESHDFLKSHD